MPRVAWAATLRRVLALAALVGLFAGWAVTLRPQQLGGPAMYIIVHGSSMLPAYENGDFVITQSSAVYSIGDVVAYRVPMGDIGEGHIVFHRLVSGDGENGFVLQGDNNRWPDPWLPRSTDMRGKAWLAVPGLGRVIAFIHQPVVIGALAMSIVVTLMLARPPAKRAALGTRPSAKGRRRPEPI